MPISVFNKASESVATAEVRQVVNVDATRVNQAAFCVTTGLALATAGSVYAVVTAAAMTTQIACGILGVICTGASFGSIAAWMDTNSRNLDTYFSNLQHHTGVAIAGMSQFVAQTMVQAVVNGLAQGVSTNIRRKISGPDFVVEKRYSTPTNNKKTSFFGA